MKIHEITKASNNVNEGILGDLKAAVTATKTGYAAGKEKGGVLSGLKGVAKNLTSRTAYNQALQQNTAKKYANDPRITKGKSPDQLLKNIQADPTVKAAIQKLLPQFQQQFFKPVPAAQPKPQTQAAQPTQATQSTAQTTPDYKDLEKPAYLRRQQKGPRTGVKEQETMSQGGIAIPAGAKTAGAKQAPRGPSAEQIGSEIEQWVKSKVKGFVSIEQNPDAAEIIEEPFEALKQAVAAQDASNLPQLLSNYLMAVKAATVYVDNKEKEKRQKQQSARVGDFGEFDSNGKENKEPIPFSAQEGSQILQSEAGIDAATFKKIKQAAVQNPDAVKAAFGIRESKKSSI